MSGIISLGIGSPASVPLFITFGLSTAPLAATPTSRAEFTLPRQTGEYTLPYQSGQYILPRQSGEYTIPRGR